MYAIRSYYAETGALIDHILSRYHERHRSELPGLLDLAEKVGRVHATDQQSPKDLAQSLTALGRELEGHMAKEEMILFPAMRAGGGAGIGPPVAVMRAEHDDHAEAIERIRKMTVITSYSIHYTKLYDSITRSGS